mmetsp:Transcript_6554/g.12169  ORF Transcript_6554/g.12169 Transcript_6554/m.12169 type:complete len:207 (-) Transcript_6554:33-653(-)
MPACLPTSCVHCNSGAAAALCSQKVNGASDNKHHENQGKVPSSCSSLQRLGDVGRRVQVFNVFCHVVYFLDRRVGGVHVAHGDVEGRLGSFEVFSCLCCTLPCELSVCLVNHSCSTRLCSRSWRRCWRCGWNCRVNPSKAFCAQVCQCNSVWKRFAGSGTHNVATDIHGSLRNDSVHGCCNGKQCNGSLNHSSVCFVAGNSGSNGQ